MFSYNRSTIVSEMASAMSQGRAEWFVGAGFGLNFGLPDWAKLFGQACLILSIGIPDNDAAAEYAYFACHLLYNPLEHTLKRRSKRKFRSKLGLLKSRYNRAIDRARLQGAKLPLLMHSGSTGFASIKRLNHAFYAFDKSPGIGLTKDKNEENSVFANFVWMALHLDLNKVKYFLNTQTTLEQVRTILHNDPKQFVKSIPIMGTSTNLETVSSFADLQIKSLFLGNWLSTLNFDNYLELSMARRLRHWKHIAATKVGVVKSKYRSTLCVSKPDFAVNHIHGLAGTNLAFPKQMPNHPKNGAYYKRYSSGRAVMDIIGFQDTSTNTYDSWRHHIESCADGRFPVLYGVGLSGDPTIERMLETFDQRLNKHPPSRSKINGVYIGNKIDAEQAVRLRKLQIAFLKVNYNPTTGDLPTIFKKLERSI